MLKDFKGLVEVFLEVAISILLARQLCRNSLNVLGYLHSSTTNIRFPLLIYDREIETFGIHGESLSRILTQVLYLFSQPLYQKQPR